MPNLFRSEEHARRWEVFRPESEEGFIALPELSGFFGTETRQHMLDADYLSRWYPQRGAERRAYLTRIGKTLAVLAWHARAGRIALGATMMHALATTAWLAAEPTLRA